MSSKSKRKSYFLSSNPSKKRKVCLLPDMKGFICTCNGNEYDCAKEALNILDEYDSQLNPKENKSEDENEDIEEALKKEVEDENKKDKDRKFRKIDTGVKNCLFIASKIHNAPEIVEKIVTDIKETKIAKSRHLIRMLPVEITCKAYLEDIKKAACCIFDKHFKCDPLTFSVIVTKRNNSNLDRMELITELVLLVKDRNLNHKVNLNSPVKSIIVEVIRNICCLSVVNSFNEHMKFNLIALASNKQTDDLQKTDE